MVNLILLHYMLMVIHQLVHGMELKIIANGNPLYIGKNNNLWLFNTYDNNASLLEFKNYCIGSTWSSTKYSFDCYGTFNAANNITINGANVATQS